MHFLNVPGLAAEEGEQAVGVAWPVLRRGIWEFPQAGGIRESIGPGSKVYLSMVHAMVFTIDDI